MEFLRIYSTCTCTCTCRILLPRPTCIYMYGKNLRRNGTKSQKQRNRIPKCRILFQDQHVHVCTLGMCIIIHVHVLYVHVCQTRWNKGTHLLSYTHTAILPYSHTAILPYVESEHDGEVISGKTNSQTSRGHTQC